MKIRKRLILYFLIVVLIVITTSSISFVSTTDVILKIRSLFHENIVLNKIMGEVTDVKSLVTLYLFSRNDDLGTQIDELIGEIETYAAELPHQPENDSVVLQKKNIRNMLQVYVDDINTVMAKSRKYPNDDVTSDYEDIGETARLLEFAISELLIEVSASNATRYVDMFEGMRIETLIGMLLLEAGLLSNLLLISAFAARISRPIEQLTEFSRKVEGGDYHAQMIRIDSKDEIGTLAHSIESMVASLQFSMYEIQENARITQLLNEQEFKTNQMKGLLAVAQQKALQAQVNPHFLYNTLNAAAQLAILEDAEKTGEYLQNVSALFRYNLSDPEGFATLKEEMAHVCRYIAIQKTRFGDNITFVQDIDKGTFKAPVPRMILQPVVENCFVHAFNQMGQGGVITIRCHVDGDYALVEVSDNGKGMTQERIDRILALEETGDAIVARSARIGLNNIVERLRIAYSNRDVIDIKSNGDGTTVRIRLPLEFVSETATVGERQDNEQV